MQPFEGIKILDLTHVLAGPFATYQLALLGAEVIKVENPNDPDQSRVNSSDEELARRNMGTNYLAHGSNKRALALDLKTAAGVAVLRKLAETADVLIENFRPGALGAVGAGYDELSKVNPRLIYCSLSAFGHTGPRSKQTAYDPIIQAAVGMMYMSGTPETAPIKSGIAAIDYSTGITAAYAVASALFQRERTKHGQRIDLAMFDAAMMLVPQALTAYLHDGTLPKPLGLGGKFASNRVYETSDGLISISATNPKQNRRLWQAVNKPEYFSSDRSTRRQNSAQEIEALTKIFKTRSAREWEDYLQAHGVPAARVYTLAEATREPQFEARELIHRFEMVPGLDGPFSVPVAGFKFAEGGPRVSSPPPRVGEHSIAILQEHGFSRDAIDDLIRTGVVKAIA